MKRKSDLFIILCCIILGLNHSVQGFDTFFKRVLDPDTNFVSAIPVFMGLEKGALISSSVHVLPNTERMTIYLFTYEQLVKNYENSGTIWRFSLPSAYRHEFYGNFSFSKEIEVEGRYYLMVRSTNGKATWLEGELHFQNPNAKQLNLQDEPLFLIHLSIGSIKAIGYVMWIFYMILYRDKVVMTQIFMTVVFTTSLLSNIFWASYYETFANIGSPNEAFRYTAATFQVISNIGFIYVLGLIATGWSIVRINLNVRERQLFIVWFCLFTTFDFLYSYCQNNSYCSAYQLSLYVLQFLVAFAVVVAVNTNIQGLTTISREISFARHDPSSFKQLYAKLDMFRKIRWVFLLYLVFPIFLLFSDFAVLSWKQSWIPKLLQSIVETFTFYVTGIYFRASTSILYFIEIPSVQDRSTPEQNSSDRDANAATENHEIELVAMSGIGGL